MTNSPLQLNRTTGYVQLNPRDPRFFNNPYPVYEELRQHAPIFYWEAFGFTCFVNHEDVATLFRDRRFGRQILHLATREELGWPPEREALRPFYDVDKHSLLDLEPPDHTRLRRLIQKAFLARKIERLRGRVASLTHQLIDEMEPAGQANLLEKFATTIPLNMIAELLGVPTENGDDLLNWSHAMVAMYELATTPQQEQKAVQAAQDFVAYLKDYVKFRRQNPQDDLITRLIEAEEEGEKLSEDELITTCILLLNAGHEATVNVIGNGVYALLKHPDQMQLWRENVGMSETAVEELLRYDTPLHLFTRWALEDVTYKGHHFPFGTKIALLLGAANRDPAAFAQPDTLNLTRSKNPHVSFGGGIHYCIGVPLARLELQTALPILLQRLPNLTLVQEPSFKNSYHFHGLESLQVAW
ncbi:MAG: cytochrome P450 hydroxylase [Ardenticatenaceae bacterium]|nr:MAG: cytochrome P450 hydroxylase [Ardenticatenaceae bacterium]